MVERKLFSSKENLEQLYVEQEKSTHEIETILKADSKTIWYWLKKYGIPIRSRSESLIGERNYWYGKQHSEEHKKQISEKLKGHPSLNKGKKIPNISLNHADVSGKKNPFYGKKHTKEANLKNYLAHIDTKASKETRQKIGKKSKERWTDKEYKKKVVISMISAGSKPEFKEKISEAARKRWSNPEYKERVLKKVIKSLHKKPNIPENKLIEIAKKHDLPLKYVGDGSIIINGCNPDFLVLNQKKLIEVFGRTFHDPQNSYLKNIPLERQEIGRKAVFNEAGFNTLILWDDELKNEELIVERIGGFINN